MLFGGNLGLTDPLSGLLELVVRRVQSSVGETIKEGNFVHLACESNCNRTHQSVTWFKNGAPVRQGSKLDLGPLSPSDSGNYTCSLSGHPGTTSAAVHMDVECENRKQNHSFTKLKLTRRLTPNVSFQTGPGTRQPVNRWRWIEAQMSPWSARALQTPPLGVTSGLESWTGSRRLETSQCGSPVRAEIISAELQINTEARTHLPSRLRSKVSLWFVERGRLKAELWVHEDCSFSLQSHAGTLEHQEPDVQGCGDHGNSSCAPPYASNVIPKYHLQFNSD